MSKPRPSDPVHKTGRSAPPGLAPKPKLPVVKKTVVRIIPASAPATTNWEPIP